METRARTQTDMSIASPQFNLYSRVLQTERQPTFHTLPQIQEMPRERPTTNLSTLSHVTWPDWDAGMQVAKCFACASTRVWRQKWTQFVDCVVSTHDETELRDVSWLLILYAQWCSSKFGTVGTLRSPLPLFSASFLSPPLPLSPLLFLPSFPLPYLVVIFSIINLL